MLGLAARRGRQQSSLARALLVRGGGALPRVVSKPLEDVAGSSRNWSSLSNLYEVVKVRGAVGNGIREFLFELRSGSRRTITGSRKVDAGVEAAAVPAGSASTASKLNFVASSPARPELPRFPASSSRSSLGVPNVGSVSVF